MTDDVDVTVFELEEFLIRDKANFWNLIKHIPAENRYIDHEDEEVSGEKIQVIVAADTTGQAKVNLEIDTEPEGTEDKMAWRASSQKVEPESGGFDTDGKSEATIYSSGIGQEPYEFYVGFDSNRNGRLDTNEEVKSVNTVRFLPKTFLENNYRILLLGAALADSDGNFKVSSTFLLTFLGFPEEANIQSVIKASTIYRLEPELTHPVGTDFSSFTGYANIDEMNFAQGSETAKKIGDSETLKEKIKEVLTKHKDGILQFFAQPNSPNSLHRDFPNEKFSIDFPQLTELDLFLGFRKANVTCDVKVIVHRDNEGQLSIPILIVDGELNDLYDFDFYDKNIIIRMGASIQFAWRSPSIRSNAGKIFRNLVNFNKEFRNFPLP